MLTKVFNLFFIIASGLLLIYTVFPIPKFPEKPPDSVQSLEAGDTESPMRRAYYTNLTREETMELYMNQMLAGNGFLMPTYRLNYPPEDAQIFIRDQTRSTFLEEIVHPFREFLFINGFEPKLDKDEIWYKGVNYRLKITVKYVTSNIYLRIGIMGIGLILMHFILKEFYFTLLILLKEWFLVKH